MPQAILAWYQSEKEKQKELIEYLRLQGKKGDNLIKECTEQLFRLENLIIIAANTQSTLGLAERYCETIKAQQANLKLLPVRQGQEVSVALLDSMLSETSFSVLHGPNLGSVSSSETCLTNQHVDELDIDGINEELLDVSQASDPASLRTESLYPNGFFRFDSANPPTSKYQGVSFVKSYKATPWRVQCRPLIELEFYKTEEDAAKALKEKVDEHLKKNGRLPPSLKGCELDENGFYLRVDKTARDLDLVLTKDTSKYQDISLQKANKCKPWRVVCMPLIEYEFYKTEEEAAEALKEKVDEHLKNDGKLPRSLKGCELDENGFYLRKNTKNQGHKNLRETSGLTIEEEGFLAKRPPQVVEDSTLTLFFPMGLDNESLGLEQAILEPINKPSEERFNPLIYKSGFFAPSSLLSQSSDVLQLERHVTSLETDAQLPDINL